MCINTLMLKNFKNLVELEQKKSNSFPANFQEDRLSQGKYSQSRIFTIINIIGSFVISGLHLPLPCVCGMPYAVKAKP